MTRLFFLLLILPLESQAQSTIYVSQSANGANNGTSWADAYVFLQDGLAAAQAGDEVWVAEGVYRPDQGAGIIPGDRDQSFVIPGGLTLRGGFSGFETEPDQADWRDHPTHLSGDLLGNDTDVLESSEPSRQDNSRTVVFAWTEDVASQTLLSGFVIEAGHTPDGRGGGMRLVTEASEWVLEDIEFRNNIADLGGGLHYAGASLPPTMRRLRFYGNIALEGGGFYSRGGARDAPVVLRDSDFEANIAGEGGGLYLIGWYDIVTCIFFGNSAVSGGGTLSAENSNVRILSSGFYGNSADWGGGGILVADPTFEGRPVQVVNSVFSGNSALIGGAILNYELDSPILVEVIQSTFFGNVASGEGADHGGGGIYHLGSAADFRVRNSVFWSNAASLGEDDIQIADGGRLPSPPGTIAATIVGDLPSDMNDLGGTIVADPLLRDPLGEDGSAGTPDDNLELTSPSLAVNSGDLQSLPQDWADLDGDGDYAERLPSDFASNRRVWPGAGGPAAPDLGAYEFEAPLATSIPEGTWPSAGESSVEIYPLPFFDFFKVRAPSDWQVTEVVIFDVLGRRVSRISGQGSASALTVDTAQLAPGLYLIRLTSTHGHSVLIIAPRV